MCIKMQMAVLFSPSTGYIFPKSPFLGHLWIPSNEHRQLAINVKLYLNKDHYLYFTINKHQTTYSDKTCLVEIEVGCFFRIFGYSVLYWDLQASHEKSEN